MPSFQTPRRGALDTCHQRRAGRSWRGCWHGPSGWGQGPGRRWRCLNPPACRPLRAWPPNARARNPAAHVTPVAGWAGLAAKLRPGPHPHRRTTPQPGHGLHHLTVRGPSQRPAQPKARTHLCSLPVVLRGERRDEGHPQQGALAEAAPAQHDVAVSLPARAGRELGCRLYPSYFMLPSPCLATPTVGLPVQPVDPGLLDPMPAPAPGRTGSSRLPPPGAAAAPP